VVFAVLLHPKAAKALKKIENSVRLRIVERLRELRNRPERVGKRLKYSDFWSLRVGDYRVIYEVDRGKDQVVVLFIGHRKTRRAIEFVSEIRRKYGDSVVELRKATEKLTMEEIEKEIRRLKKEEKI